MTKILAAALLLASFLLALPVLESGTSVYRRPFA
jgi:hypothetical protein